MAKTVTKKFTLLDIVTLSEYFSRDDVKSRMNCLSIQAKWAIKKNCNAFNSFTDAYYSVRNDLIESIRKEYFSDEKSEECEVLQKDDAGNEILDENGHPLKTMDRQVKQEYMADYQSEISKSDQKLQEILSDTNDVEIVVIDLDKEIENIPESHQFDLTMEDLDVLNIFNINKQNVSR